MDFDLKKSLQILERTPLILTDLSKADFARIGIHPDFGEVTLAELLSTWTVHDLTHIAQVARVMGKQYKTSIGPWIKYFRLLQ